MPPIRHVVLINWKNDVLPGQIEDWVKLCNRIPEECPMVYNWVSSHCVVGPDPDRPSTHQFGIMFDLRSDEDWKQYLKHPYPETVYAEGMKIIDLERTASANMLVEAKPVATRAKP